MALASRPWIPTDDFITAVAADFAALDPRARRAALNRQVEENARIHDRDCINLNPATNVMSPAAERLLGAGLGSRPSLGYPGDKYEMGLEAIERIEIFAAELACEVFRARHAEIRVVSGAMSNLYAFMACCQPGDRIVVPPAEIGGHVTHHRAGAAGLYGLDIIAAPYDADRYTVDVDALADLVAKQRPRLVTLGGSLNINHHPVAEVCEIAHRHDARVLFDAAHLSGPIAGGRWPNPLDAGADLMTMSTYKSLGGPPAGLVLTNDADLARRIEAIAFPGLTANFDAANSAALALCLLDWVEFGADYAAAMVSTASRLGEALLERGLPVFGGEAGFGRSHQLALEAAAFGGGQAMAKRLRDANLLTCGIGLPLAPVAGDMNGLRLGTPECARRGMGDADMEVIAGFLDEVLGGRRPPAAVAADVTAMRARFGGFRFVGGDGGEPASPRRATRAGPAASS